MVPCHAASAHHTRICAIYSGWQLPDIHPVIDEAGACFDHYSYVQWISVHLRDMMTLSHLHPPI